MKEIICIIGGSLCFIIVSVVCFLIPVSVGVFLFLKLLELAGFIIWG